MSGFFRKMSGARAALSIDAPKDIEVGAGFVERNGIWQPQPPPDFLGFTGLFGSGTPSNIGSFVPPVYFNSFYSPYTNITIAGMGRTRAPKPDEVDTTRTEPFVGWKTLSIVVTKKGKLKLLGYGDVKYGITATAICNAGGNHEAPEWTCGCGFYALSEKPESPEHGWFRAEVELFGTVIEGQYGWRGSRQRVLSLDTFAECQATSGRDEWDDPLTCDRNAVGFQVSQVGRVWPVCKKHAPLGYATTADLTARLGTEVRWTKGE